MTKVLLVADSRGGGLQSIFTDMMDRPIEVDVYPGAGLQTLFMKTRALLLQKYRDIVFVLGGICDLSSRDPRTKLITMYNLTETEFAEKLKAIIDQGLIDINAEFPNTQIVLCPLTGVDIRQYNKLSEIPDDQVRMNYTVTTINAMIKACNTCRNLPTP